jgi:hypothetical protein
MIIFALTLHRGAWRRQGLWFAAAANDAPPVDAADDDADDAAASRTRSVQSPAKAVSVMGSILMKKARASVRFLRSPGGTVERKGYNNKDDGVELSSFKGSKGIAEESAYGGGDDAVSMSTGGAAAGLPAFTGAFDDVDADAFADFDAGLGLAFDTDSDEEDEAKAEAAEEQRRAALRAVVVQARIRRMRSAAAPTTTDEGGEPKDALTKSSGAQKDDTGKDDGKRDDDSDGILAEAIAGGEVLLGNIWNGATMVSRFLYTYVPFEIVYYMECVIGIEEVGSDDDGDDNDDGGGGGGGDSDGHDVSDGASGGGRDNTGSNGAGVGGGDGGGSGGGGSGSGTHAHAFKVGGISLPPVDVQLANDFSVAADIDSDVDAATDRDTFDDIDIEGADDCDDDDVGGGDVDELDDEDFDASVEKENSEFLAVVSGARKFGFRSESDLGEDWYTWTFITDLLAAIYILLFFSQMATTSHDGTGKGISSNLLPGDLVVTFTIQLLIIIGDRVIYLFRSLPLKVLMQHVTLAYWITRIFFVWPVESQRPFLSNTPAVWFFFIKSAYFACSAMQIYHGYPPPELSGHMYLTKRASIVAGGIFQVWRGVPFLSEMRTILDWMCTPTTLDVFETLRLEDIYALLFITKCDIIYRHQRRRFEMQSMANKVLMGVSVFSLLCIILLGPLFLFSSANPASETNNVLSGDLQITLVSPYNEYELLTVSKLESKAVVNEHRYVYMRRLGIVYDNAQETVQNIHFSKSADDFFRLTPPTVLDLKSLLLPPRVNKTRADGTRPALGDSGGGSDGGRAGGALSTLEMRLTYSFRRRGPPAMKQTTGREVRKLTPRDRRRLYRILFQRKSRKARCGLCVRQIMPMFMRLQPTTSPKSIAGFRSLRLRLVSGDDVTAERNGGEEHDYNNEECRCDTDYDDDVDGNDDNDDDDEDVDQQSDDEGSDAKKGDTTTTAVDGTASQGRVWWEVLDVPRRVGNDTSVANQRPSDVYEDRDAGDLNARCRRYRTEPYNRQLHARESIFCSPGPKTTTASDPLFSSLLSIGFSYSIVGLYLTVVYAVGRGVRMVTLRLHQRIQFEDVCDVDDLMMFCEGIYISRIRGDWRREEELYRRLVYIYRAPALLLALTSRKDEDDDAGGGGGSGGGGSGGGAPVPSRQLKSPGVGGGGGGGGGSGSPVLSLLLRGVGGSGSSSPGLSSTLRQRSPLSPAQP